MVSIQPGFNPVLGFLVVSTLHATVREEKPSGFNPVLGFLVVSTFEFS